MEKKHPFFLEIRKLVPCHKRQIIEESQNDFPSFLTQHYEKIAEIGKGAQGRVYKVREKSTQQIKAMKCMKTRDPELISQYKKEYKICSSLSHPGIMRYEEYITKENSIWHCFLMEYSEYQPLPEFLCQNKEFFQSELNLKTFILNLMNIVVYLHKRKIVHRDIKPKNLLISQDGRDLKLIDFGVARKLENADIMFSPQGDFKFRSPECNFEGGYNEKCDIWSCSLVILSMIFGEKITTKNIEKQTYDLEKNLKNFSPEFIILLKRMNEKNPDLRISAEEIVAHSWLNGLNAQSQN